MLLCVISLGKRVALRPALCFTVSLLLATPSLAKEPNAVSLTIDQSRQVAVQALSTGRPGVAAQIAAGLLQRDRGDAFAHFVLARAFQQMQQPDKGRRAAGRAYRHAKTPTQKFEASQLAASLSYEHGAPGLAQIWLRRSWNHAPSDKAKAVLKRDYGILRQLNPWQVQGRFSIVPSDNINNGSRDPFLFIDGVPFVGLLSRDARALSGTKMISDVSLSYRLRQTKQDQTRITGRLYMNHVHLSDEARRQAPSAQNGDFAYSDVSIGVEHQVSRSPDTQSLYALSAGRLWYAGRPSQDRISLGLTHIRPYLPKGRLRLTSNFQRASPANGQPNLYQAELGAQWDLPLVNGDRWGVGLTAKLVETRSRLHQEQRASTHLTYRFGKAMGPAKLSLTVGASLGRYPNYALGSIVVPGGRADQSLFGSATLTFDQFDYAGFAPTLTVHAQKNRSNVSRFSSDTISVSLGFVSRF